MKGWTIYPYLIQISSSPLINSASLKIKCMSRVDNGCKLRISPWHSRNESGPYTYYFLLQYAINHYNNNFRFFGTRLSLLLWSSRKLSTTLHYHYYRWVKEIKLFCTFSQIASRSILLLFMSWFLCNGLTSLR